MQTESFSEGDVKKRNSLWDASDGGESDNSSSVNSENREESKTQYFRQKRRKLDRSDALEEESDHGDANDGGDAKTAATLSGNRMDILSNSPAVGSESQKVLNKAKLEKHRKRIRKTGVIYISRVPPFMKPTTLRQLLTPYGVVLRIFLTPEPAPRYQARVRAGGNKKKSFIDGWVEFESKREAKLCAEMLNGNNIGGKKGGFYHDDIWNLKYLKGFKWNDLMEQVQIEEREREGRLQAEIERERRERKIFTQNAERAKMERGIMAKRKLKLEDDQGESITMRVHERAKTTPLLKEVGDGFQMSFKQNLVRSNTDKKSSDESALQRTLGKIF